MAAGAATALNTDVREGVAEPEFSNYNGRYSTAVLQHPQI